MRSGTWNRTVDGRELGKEEEVGGVERSPTTAGALIRQALLGLFYAYR